MCDIWLSFNTECEVRKDCLLGNSEYCDDNTKINVAFVYISLLPLKITKCCKQSYKVKSCCL